MKIAVCGLTGTGKTTAAKHVASLLGITHISFTFKDEAKRRGISLPELQELAEKDKNIDVEFDSRQKDEMGKHKSFVVSTWLGPWFAQADINVWLYAEDSVRAARLAKRDNVSYETALHNMHRRDIQNKERYLALYNINIMDLNKFHICINSGVVDAEKLARIIVDASRILG